MKIHNKYVFAYIILSTTTIQNFKLKFIFYVEKKGQTILKGKLNLMT